MPRATVSPERLQALTDELSRLAIAAQVEPALAWAAGLTPEERKALTPVTLHMHTRPTGKDSRDWHKQRQVVRAVNALCGQKPKELVAEHWSGFELRQLLAHGPLPWLDVMRTQGNRRGGLGLGITWADDHWLMHEGHVSVPLTDRMRAELIGTYPFVGGYDWHAKRPISGPDLAEVPAEFWAQDFWLLFTLPLGPQAPITPDSSQQNGWIPAFVQAAGQFFSRETAIARLLASLQIPALKQNQIGWQVQLLGALAPTPAEWAAHPAELLLALASPLSTVQGMGLQAWLALVQADAPGDARDDVHGGLQAPLPLVALLQELGVLWAVKTKAVHKQALTVLEALAQRIAREPDAALQAELRQAWREAAVLGLIQPDASHQKRLLQLLMQQVPDCHELAALLAGSLDLIGQAGRQLLSKVGVNLQADAASEGQAASADALLVTYEAKASAAGDVLGDVAAAGAWPVAGTGTPPAAEPTPVDVQAGSFEDWAIDLVAALRAGQSHQSELDDLARWHRALHGLAVHGASLTPEQLTQLGPAWMQANTGFASPLSTLFVAQVKRIAGKAPPLQVVLTQLAQNAKNKLGWHNHAHHTDALRKALAHPTSGPLLQAMRWRMRQADPAVRALPLLSAPSHRGAFVGVPVLLNRVAALAAAGLDVAALASHADLANRPADDSRALQPAPAPSPNAGNPQALVARDLADEASSSQPLAASDLQADLQLALHRLWLPAPGSAAHHEALRAVSAYTAEKTGGSCHELPRLLTWLLSGEHALPADFAPAHPAWWADAALAHGRDVTHPALQVGEHPLAHYAGMRFALATMRADEPEALAPELTAAEADLAYPSKASEALMSGWLTRRAHELGLGELAPYLVKLGLTGRSVSGGAQLAAEQTSAQQLQQIAGNSWAADALRRFRIAYRHLRLERQSPALWAERAIESMRSAGGWQHAADWLPTLPALWVGASLGDFHELVIGAVIGRAPNWPQADTLRSTLAALAQRPEQTGPWDDARCTVLALALADKDAATRGQAVQLLRVATHTMCKPGSPAQTGITSRAEAPAPSGASGTASAQAHGTQAELPSQIEATTSTASAALARVLALLLRNLQISLPRLADSLRNDALPEPGLAPVVAGLMLATLAQLPAEPLRGHKALLELASDALGQCANDLNGPGVPHGPTRAAVLRTLPAPLASALHARLQAWAQVSTTKSAAKSLQQVLAQAVR